MTKINSNTKNRVKSQTIIVLVDCLQGGVEAGRFVLNHLYKGTDRLVLLQVYKAQGVGLFLMRNLSTILENTSLEELTIVKDKLIEEFDIEPDKIEKMVAEGDISTILKNNFSNESSPIVVIGEDTELLKHKIPQRHISSIIKGKTRVKNIIYVEDNVTLINSTKIINISKKLKKRTRKFDNYLVELSEKYGLELEYVNLKGEDITLINERVSYNLLSDDSDYNQPDNIIHNIISKSLIKAKMSNEKVG